MIQFQICDKIALILVCCVWLRAFVPSGLSVTAANCAVCTNCANSQTKNSTVEEAVHVHIPKISSFTGTVRLEPKN